VRGVFNKHENPPRLPRRTDHRPGTPLAPNGALPHGDRVIRDAARRELESDRPPGRTDACYQRRWRRSPRPARLDRTSESKTVIPPSASRTYPIVCALGPADAPTAQARIAPSAIVIVPIPMPISPLLGADPSSIESKNCKYATPREREPSQGELVYLLDFCLGASQLPDQRLPYSVSAARCRA
jgi:hypothetical protein